MTLNLVCLLGWVAEPPHATPATAPADATYRFRVATREAPPRERVDRHVIVVPAHLAESVAALRTGQPLYLEGRLVGTTDTDVDGRRHRRVEVIAHTLWPVEGPPEPLVTTADHLGTHASPRAHERQGHWRRVALGRREERLVWVRATTVGTPRATRT
jgi:hypothetical protein